MRCSNARGMACCWVASSINTRGVSRDGNQRYKDQAEMITLDLFSDIRTSCGVQETSIKEVPGNCDRLRKPVSITVFYFLSISGDCNHYEEFPCLEKKISFLRKENFSITPAMISVLFVSFLCGKRVSDHYLNHCNVVIAFSVWPKARLVIIFTTVFLSRYWLVSSLRFAPVYPGAMKGQLVGE